MSTPIRRAATTPTHVAVALLIAFCALLLFKWLAVVALAAVGVAATIRWARRDPTAIPGRTEPAQNDPARTGPARTELTATPRVPVDDDCSWCGRPGGHRDAAGRLMRPRHAHGASRT